MATAAYLLSERVATGFADERLEDVALRITRANAHHLIVIHESNKTFVGLIKLSDIAGHRDPGNRILGDLVSKIMPVIVDSKESAAFILEMFEQHKLGEAIVTKEGIYVGLITAESIFQWSRQQQSYLSKQPLLTPLSLGAGERLNSVPQFPRAEEKTKNIQTLVLLVEDHMPSRRALSSILAKRNLRVVEAASVQEALTLFEQHAFALVISDISLPDGSGFDLIVHLRSHSSIKAISISAFAGNRYSVESKAAGFDFHFTKPLDMRTLDAAIQHLLGNDPTVFLGKPKI